MNWSNILERAAWTAVQSGLATVPTTQIAAAVADGDLSAVATLALSGLGAGIGAALSFIKTIAQERLEQL